MASNASSDSVFRRPATGCAASDQCRPAVGVLRALGVPPSEMARFPWRWAHLGPIRDGVNAVHTHLDGVDLVGWHPLRPGLLAAFEAYRLDALGSRGRPPFLKARYHASVGLWVVYAAASNDAEGCCAEWSATPDGPGRIHKYYDDVPVTAKREAVLDRCLDLTLDRLVRRGARRDPEAQLAKMRAAVESVDQKHEKHPRITEQEACVLAGQSPRTIREYRRALQREQHDIQVPGQWRPA